KEKEMDILFSLMFKARDKGTDEINLSYNDISKLIALENNRDRVPDYILGLSKKLKALNQMIKKPNGDIVLFGLFDKIHIKVEEREVSFKVNEEFSYLLNNLIGNFTMFDLKDLVSLKGNYAKVLFRLLKQWQSTREVIISMTDFRELMNIPENYEQFNINQKVLNPCLEQLKQHFKDLKVEKIKKGVKIDRLRFTWKLEERAVKRDVGSVVMRTGLTAEDYQKEFSEVEEREEVKIELTAEEIHLKEFKSYLQKKSQVELGNKYLVFFARMIPMRDIEKILNLCEEFGLELD
ncbi:MAG: replication initiation protein, partial [Cetobacterium sp.]